MTLTTDISVKVAPLFVQTLLRHYLSERDSDDSKAKEELLYDEAFAVVKAFLDAATKHTVEEIQEFSNTRIPAPYWIHTVNVLVPMSCCDRAAKHLITAFGGEDFCKKVAGGTKWWQVRGLQGVDSQWISVKKDWEEAEKRRKTNAKERQKDAGHSHTPDGDGQVPQYQAEMDDMRCMLYIHGGGYYFGSVDQQRYCMQRYARKMNGRVFAVNYRLAPQYPFPCALQDCLAAYLYLIQPPPDAQHAPVSPQMLVFGGDSAGGGLVLGLLQIIRDSGLPLPAGAVLISPWADLTHSFPSIHLNTKTDITPPYGLSMHKPSVLWPPPPEDMTKHVRIGLTSRIMKAARRHKDPSDGGNGHNIPITSRGDTKTKIPSGSAHSRTASATPLADCPDTPLTLDIDGSSVTIRSQIQLYAPNHLLTHPLVSSALGYLGGLPPLFVLASDKEVLRDEIIYIAHKAANPEKYPVKPESKRMYPAYDGIESKYGPTKVHLQVYDETCHVLPLFAFCTPAKFAYRAIATFCKEVMPGPATSGANGALTLASPISDSNGTFRPLLQPGDRPITPESLTTSLFRRLSSFGLPKEETPTKEVGEKEARPQAHDRESSGPDVAGPRFTMNSPSMKGPDTAGHPATYSNKPLKGMIRERVTTKGVVREMEPESEIPALQLPLELVGVINARSAKRYLEAQAMWDKKFKGQAKTILQQRKMQLERAQLDTTKALNRLSTTIFAFEEESDRDLVDRVLNSNSWSWAWALAGDENPPPSSIVARRDTEEARRLSKIADEALTAHQVRMSGNNFWSFIMNTLSVSPLAKANEKSKDVIKDSRDKLTGSSLSTPARSGDNIASPQHSISDKSSKKSGLLRMLSINTHKKPDDQSTQGSKSPRLSIFSDAPEERRLSPRISAHPHRASQILPSTLPPLPSIEDLRLPAITFDTPTPTPTPTPKA